MHWLEFISLDAELLRAMRFARQPEIELGFTEMRFGRHVQWGFARVDYYGLHHEFYEPMPDGKVMAFIVPCVEGGELVDLCAVHPVTQHVGTRLGYGRALGLPAVDKARMGYQLKLKARPLDWLRDPVDSVYLFDLGQLPVVLDGVEEIACPDLELADRVAALLPPSQRHRAQVI